MQYIEEIQQRLPEILELCRRSQVQRLELIGSASSNTFNKDSSDIDFLVEFLPLSPSVHAQCYFSMLQELQDIFKRQIDLIEVKAVSNPYFLSSIEKTRSVLYAA